MKLLNETSWMTQGIDSNVPDPLASEVLIVTTLPSRPHLYLEQYTFMTADPILPLHPPSSHASQPKIESTPPPQKRVPPVSHRQSYLDRSHRWN